MSDTGELLATVQITGIYPWPFYVSVNQNTGECWASIMYENEVIKISEAGTILTTYTGLEYPWDIGVYAGDGSCWVVGPTSDCLIKLSSDGNELFRLDDSILGDHPQSLSVDPNDGSCWVGCSDSVVKVSATGVVLFSVPTTDRVWELDINPADGSCFAAAVDNSVTKFDQNGNQIWHTIVLAGTGYIRDISVNSADGTCWVAYLGETETSGVVYKLDANGNTVLNLSDKVNAPSSVCVYNP